MIKRKLLIVDDDTSLRAGLVENFAPYEEYDCVHASTAQQAIDIVRAGGIDLMLLDVGLPDMDGRDALKQMRDEGFASPVIIITGHDSDADEVLGLDSGANDYVLKPVRFSVLLARVRAAFRQHDQSEAITFTVGPYLFQPSTRILETSAGEKIRLTDKETSIMKFLYRAGPNTVSRDVLLAEVWGYNNRVTTHTLETHIYRLRQKIERDPSKARILVTDEGGYRLVP